MRLRGLTWTTCAAAATAGLYWTSMPVAQEININEDRYDQRPMLDTEVAPDVGSTTSEAIPSRFLRFVEGIDNGARPLSQADVDRDIQDPFGQLLLAQAPRLPKTLENVLDMIGPPGQPPLGDQTTYIVSASGQITLDAAPNLTRRPRAVVLRRDDRAKDAVFIAPSMRDDGALEVMGWDPNKGLFNYYERRFVRNDPNEEVWIWKGDGSQAWDEATRNHACFRCHRSGEINMKELRLPWQNWHSQSATIKPDSIPPDSPLRTNPIFSIEPPSPFLNRGEDFERIANQWITNSNRTKIERIKIGDLDDAAALLPFFQTTTGQLKSSVEQSAPTGTNPITLPVAMFIDQRGLLDMGGLFCDRMSDLPAAIKIPRSTYRQALAALNFRLEDPGKYLERPGDTHFALLTSEVPRVDFDLIDQMVKNRLIARQTAVNLMLIDVENPVYSKIRAWIYDRLKADETTLFDGSFDEGLIDFLQRLDSLNTPENVRQEIVEFLTRQTLSGPDFEAKACERVNHYLRGVVAQFKTGNTLQYMRLIASRHRDFSNSDHARLIESQLLLPKSDPISGLAMRRDGTVGPSPLANP